MTDQDRTKPPSDELIATVLKKYHGIDVPTIYSYSMTGEGIVSLRPLGGEEIDVVDPRYDTDAALGLLRWVLIQYEERNSDYGYYLGVGRLGWNICNYAPCQSCEHVFEEGIPISDQPMRTAVCWLAVDVLGVG